MLSKTFLIALLLAVVPLCAQQPQPGVSKPTEIQQPAGKLPVEPSKLSAAIRASYYHPDSLNAMECNLAVDWPTFFSALKTTVPDDRIKALQGLKIHSRAERGKPAALTFDWAGGQISTRDQLESGLKQMVDGFYQIYWPTLAGPLVGEQDKLEDIKPLPDGGAKTSALSGGMHINIVVDKSAAPTHYDFQSPALKGNVDISYLPASGERPETPPLIGGLKMDEGIGESTFKVDMNVDYQTVEGLEIPRNITFGVIGAFTIKMELTECAISKGSPSQ
ncbi:MAG TPA: hypothetical protein VE291_11115 [Terracidiphilus sp.]|jgi:hypothetical protein|nr:hypothetical protein [Terracidiphilus sp.]